MSGSQGKSSFLGAILVLILILGVLFLGLTWFIRSATNQALSPLNEANDQLKTQVSNLLNPTPTILPDPITIITEVRSLARLETIEYTVEKVITAEIGQGQLAFLFGDKLLFVAHGRVIAGIDLEKLTAEDIWLDGETLYVKLPPAEVFVATLDNEKSYVYDRETGIFTHGAADLETQARQVAETEIYNAAIEDGILAQAQQNAENYMERLLRSLGYATVLFVTPTPTPTP
jgi:HAMP domain-containing protein